MLVRVLSLEVTSTSRVRQSSSSPVGRFYVHSNYTKSEVDVLIVNQIAGLFVFVYAMKLTAICRV